MNGSLQDPQSHSGYNGSKVISQHSKSGREGQDAPCRLRQGLSDFLVPIRRIKKCLTTVVEMLRLIIFALSGKTWPNFTGGRGVFTLGVIVKGCVFSGLSLANRMRVVSASEGRKPRIPSGIEGWAGFLSSAFILQLPSRFVLKAPFANCAPLVLRTS